MEKLIVRKFASYTEEASSLKNEETLEVDWTLEHQPKVERKPIKEERKERRKRAEKEEEEKEISVIMESWGKFSY